MSPATATRDRLIIRRMSDGKRKQKSTTAGDSRSSNCGRLPDAINGGSCRQSHQQLMSSYNTRYQHPQQHASTPFYDALSPYDYAVGGPILGARSDDHLHTPGQPSFCALPQPAHCGAGIARSSAVGRTSWAIDQSSDGHRSAANGEVASKRRIEKNVVKEEYSEPSDISSSSEGGYSDQDWTSSRSASIGRSVRGLNESTTSGYEGQLSDKSTQRSRPIQSNRSRRRETKLTTEEEQRRRVRRERNKLAAARCRQRRVDLTNQLLAETESLEDEKLRLEKEISNLQRQRNQLEFVLEAHVPRCQVLGSVGPGASLQQPPAAHGQPSTAFNGLGGMPPPVHNVHSTHESVAKTDHTVVAMTTAEHRVVATSSSSSYVTSCGRGRPASLSISRLNAATSGDVTLTPGVFDSLGLDCMIDGHTGLTPITGAPSCGGQRGTPDDVTMNELSPTTLMTL